MIKLNSLIFISALSYICISITAGIGITATVVDISGESTSVHNLNLSNWHPQRWTPINWEWSSFDTMRLMKGRSEVDIPFKNIDYLEYDWSKSPPEAEIKTVNGQVLKGQPLRIGENWYFRAQTDYGEFKLSTNDTKRIEFSFN